MFTAAQDFLSFDEQKSLEVESMATTPPLPHLSFDAQISLENAARQRYFERTGKTVPLLDGGIKSAPVLATLCEHCGQRAGKAHHVTHTARPVHICDACALQDRRAADAVDALFGAAVRARPVLMLPSELRPPRRRMPARRPA